MANSTALQKSLFDQSFVDQKSQLELYFQLSKTQLHVCYLNANSLQFVGFEKYALGENTNWSQTLESLRLIVHAFPKEFKKVSVSVCSSLFTLSPTALFDSNHQAELFNLNHSKLINSGDLLNHEVKSLQLSIVFELPFLIQNLFNAHFGPCSFVHESSVFLEIISSFKQKANNQLFAQIHDDHFQLAYIKNQKLHFYNQFEYKSVEDFMYFLLYVTEQLEIDRDKIPLQLMGKIETDSPIYQMVFKYLRDVSIAELNPSIKSSQVLSQINLSHFYNLFNQYLCES
tara:strand:+ start:2635 stop:3492 length:858 start_codon:yes stop_codon:yes gene_type:complete